MGRDSFDDEVQQIDTNIGSKGDFKERTQIIEKASESGIHLQMRGSQNNKIHVEETLIGISQGFS